MRSTKERTAESYVLETPMIDLEHGGQIDVRRVGETHVAIELMSNGVEQQQAHELRRSSRA